MDVVVFGKHVEVSPALRAFTLEKLERIDKFANDVRRVDVDYEELATKREADSHTCEILVHLNKHLVKGRARADDHVAALDVALDKVERQMRRLHDRRVHRRNGSKSARGPAARRERRSQAMSSTHQSAVPVPTRSTTATTPTNRSW